MELLSSEELKQIQKHKYRSEGLSILEPFIDPYWRKFVTKLPRWLSPNAVTLTGLLSIILPCSALLVYSYQGDFQRVSYISFFCSLGYIVWLNLDCIDGKLARRNRPNQTSPLGELLDHGGDAFVFLITSTALSCQIGLQKTPILTLVFVFINICTGFIAEPWTIYLTGVLQYQRFDIIEVTVIMSAISLITGLYGVGIWEIVIFKYYNLQLRHLILGVQILILPDMIFGKFPLIYTGKKQKGLQLFEVLSPAVPQAILISSAAASFYFANMEFLQKNIILFVLFFGIIEVKMHIRFIVIHMINTKFKAFDRCLLLPAAFTCGVYVSQSAVMHEYLLFAALIFAMLDAGVYVFQLCYQLYHAFDERIFILDVPDQDEKVDKFQNGANVHRQKNGHAL